jgi:hypothetical protein
MQFAPARSIVVPTLRLMSKRYPEAIQTLEGVIAQTDKLPTAFSGRSLTPGSLRLDPLWDPLRNDPRFLVLVEAK